MKFRSLTVWEIEVITNGLEALCYGAYPKSIQQSARAMLDQKMPEDFLWKEGSK
jgi:flagellar motor component MotA